MVFTWAMPDSILPGTLAEIGYTVDAPDEVLSARLVLVDSTEVVLSVGVSTLVGFVPVDAAAGSAHALALTRDEGSLSSPGVLVLASGQPAPLEAELLPALAEVAWRPYQATVD